MGLEDLLPGLTHVAGKLVQGLRFSCGLLHGTAGMFSGPDSWLPSGQAVQKRKSQEGAGSFLGFSFGNHVVSLLPHSVH